MERHEIFTQIYISLKKSGRVSNKGDFARKIGVSGDTITRIINHGSKVTDDTFMKIERKFPDMVDWSLITGQQKASEPAPSADPPAQTLSIIDLYAQLIKEVESLRRDLEQERQQTRDLNQQMQASIDKLTHLLSSEYKTGDVTVNVTREDLTTT